MKKNDIKRILQDADARTVQEITEQYPPSGSEAKERIYAKLHARRSGSPDAEMDGTVIEAKPQIFWKLTAVAAAAVIILIPCGLFAMQHHLLPGRELQPATEVQQPSEESSASDVIADVDPGISLADANERDARWKGHVIQAEQLAGIPFLEALLTCSGYNGDMLDSVSVAYQDPADPIGHSINIYYSPDPMEHARSHFIDGRVFGPALIGTINLPLPTEDTGEGSFWVDMGTYRVLVTMSGVTNADFTEIVTVLADALQGGTEEQFERVQDTLRQQLAVVNSLNYPWSGHVLQAEQIGEMAFSAAFEAQGSYSDEETWNQLTVEYRDTAHLQEHYAEIVYTMEPFTDTSDLIPAAEFSTALVGTDRLPQPDENGGRVFVVDATDYRIYVKFYNVTDDELTELIRVLSDALNYEQAAPPQKDTQLPTGEPITWQKAQELTGDLFPWEQMGYEDNGTLMTLQSAEWYRPNGGNIRGPIFGMTYENGNGGTLEIMAAKKEDFDRILDLGDEPPVLDVERLFADSLPDAAEQIGDNDSVFRFCIGDDKLQITNRDCDVQTLETFCEFYRERSAGKIQASRLSPERANSLDFPWKGHVLTETQIGRLPLFHIELHKPEEFIIEQVAYLLVEEQNADSDGNPPAIIVKYTTATPEQLDMTEKLVTEDLSAASLMTEERFENDSLRCCVLDKDAYRIQLIFTNNVTEEELQSVLQKLN